MIADLHAWQQEVIDLSQRNQQLLWEEVARVCRGLKAAFPDPSLKLNVAALGNMVRRRSLPSCSGLCQHMMPLPRRGL